MCNNTNKCGCEPICGCQQPCSCPCPCQPTPCDEGCLTDTKTDCVFLSSDLGICSEVLPKGSTVTEALTKLGEAVCDGVTVTVQDMKVKVDANDTTSGYLFDKLTVCNNLEKTVTNINGNETLQICSKIDTVTSGNILTSGPNGLYVPTPTPTGYSLTPLFSNTVQLTVAPIPGGQSIKADAKISPNAGNLLVDNGGLYVSMPTLPNAITVSELDTNSINTSVILSGTNYQVSSSLRLDPTSTAPVSITVNGLKVDCCQPIIPANTPITIIPTTSVALTASGVDNHTLQANVVISPSVGNALVNTANGLYCPTPGAASPTSIIDSPTINATLINPTTYSLAVVPSLDSCNAVTTGSDGGVYVNGVSEPYGLYFYTDGTDLKLGFKGPSTNPSDYIVELQGTTGNPSLWIPGSFQILDGDTLIYDVASTSVCARINARVKYVCGANESDWVGESYTILPTFVSETGTISIVNSSSGVCGEVTIDTVCTNCVTPTNVGFNYSNTGKNHIKIILGVIPTNVISYSYTFTVNGINAGSGTIPAISGSHKLLSSVEIVTGNLIALQVAAICKGGCQSTYTSSFGTNAIIEPDGCDTDWINFPSIGAGWIGGTFSGDALFQFRNAGIPQYRVNGEYIELRGTIVRVNPNLAYTDNTNTLSILKDTDIDDIIDFTSIVTCFNPIGAGNSNFGLKDHHTSLEGVYSYSSITPSYRHLDTVELYLVSVGGILKVIWDKRAEMLDPNEVAAILFPTPLDKFFSVSLEGVKIKLV